MSNVNTVVATVPSLSEFESSLHLPPGHAPIAPEKSPQDKREFRVITLPNALTALLVSDPETDKAAASMDVNVGSFAEPSETLGLAHFLEHMLFMGTEKFPDENSYSLVINNFGGGQNAYTTREHTNYIFDVTKDHLRDVLDRFAQFFIAPLCLADAVNRELLAVNNENSRNLQLDMWRIMQVAESTLNPAHPISRFSTGNFETLRDAPAAAGIDVREKLLSFYKSHYSANLMKLCVVGAESLDTLEEMVRTSFGPVPNSDFARPSFLHIPVALPEHTCTITRVVPVKNQRSLEIEFMLPPLHHLYRAAPGRLVAHCLAHEAAGSLAHLLKARSLVNELRSGAPEENSSYAVFSIQLELTESGLEHLEYIVALTFSYIAMLQKSLKEQPDAWKAIYEEVRAVQEMEFIFREKSEPIYFAEDLAARLASIPAQHVLSSAVPREYNHSLLVDFVDQLASVTNMRARVVAPEFKSLANLQTERWYGTQYTLERMSDELLAKLRAPQISPLFTLPPTNPFISTNFVVKHAKIDAAPDAKPPLPKHIQCFCHSKKAAGVHLPAAAAAAVETAASGSASTDSECGASSAVELYYAPDHTFAQPKSHVNIQLASSFVNATPRTYSIASLWQDIVDDALSDISHFASEAQLGNYCWPTAQGLQLSFTGFSDKLGLLLDAVLPKLRGLRVAGVRDAQFARLKEQYMRGLLQYKKSNPLTHARDDARIARLETTWSVDDQLASFADISAADVDSFTAEWFSAAKVYVLILGNYSEEEAKGFATKIQETFQLAPLLPSQTPTQRCVRLDPSVTYVRQCLNRNADESNSCCFNTYQIDRATPHVEAHLSLLAHILADATFDQLRTKEALGYIAQAYSGRTAGVLSLHVAVQSSDASAAYLDCRIEAFLAWFRAHKLAALCAETPDFLAQNKKSLVANLTEKEKNLGEVASRLWGEIERRRFNFHHNYHVAAEVELITLESLLDFFDKFLAIGIKNNQRAKISVQYNAHAHGLPEQYELDTQEKVAFGNEKLVVKAPAAASAGGAAAAAEGESAAAGAGAVPAVVAEDVSLPPVPIDWRSRVYVEDLVDFRRSCSTFPASL